MDIFNNEFRACLSLTRSPLPSSICFSKAHIEWMLVSRPILASSFCQHRGVPRNVYTYTEVNDFS